MAKKSWFHQKKQELHVELKKTHRKYRKHTEIVTYEEITWMLAGVLMGILAMMGAYYLLLLVPVVLIFFFAIAKHHEKHHGLKNVFGERYKNP